MFLRINIGKTLLMCVFSLKGINTYICFQVSLGGRFLSKDTPIFFQDYVVFVFLNQRTTLWRRECPSWRISLSIDLISKERIVNGNYISINVIVRGIRSIIESLIWCSIKFHSKPCHLRPGHHRGGNRREISRYNCRPFHANFNLWWHAFHYLSRFNLDNLNETRFRHMTFFSIYEYIS